MHPAFRVPGHLLRRAFQAHDLVFARETAGFDITSPQLATLIAIGLRAGIEVTALAEMVGYDPATLSSLVNRLIAKRLVRRAVGKQDRRTRQLSLTAKGEALVADVAPHANRVGDVLLAPLTSAEREVFFRLLERVIGHVASLAEPAASEVA